MSKKILVLLHGWLSTGSSDKAKYFTEELAIANNIEVISPTLPLEKPTETTIKLKNLFDSIFELYGTDVQKMVFGTSLGAFWAELCGIIEQCPVMLVNPCFNVSTLTQYINQPLTNYQTQESSYFNHEDFEAYLRTQKVLNDWIMAGEQKQPFHVVTATGDDLISTDSVQQHYGPRVQNNGNKLTIYAGGDHRFSDFPFLIKLIKGDFGV
jgi:predicted esterase YcpF (UPF0227 family)